VEQWKMTRRNPQKELKLANPLFEKLAAVGRTLRLIF
jgi:hypothetical protein